MPRLKHKLPRYRCKVVQGRKYGVITLNGKDHYLGDYQSPESFQKRDNLLAEWLAHNRRLPSTCQEKTLITVVEVLAQFWKHAQVHYRRDGIATGTADNFKPVISQLRTMYGKLPAIDFGPSKLKALRQRLIQEDQSRRYINDNISRIKQIFRWAVSEELVPSTIWESLRSVTNLQKGRSEARETPKVRQVEQQVVDQTLRFLPDVVADMVRFQLFTGCRPGEACSVRPCDIDRSSEIWTYTPETHKTAHHDKDRKIRIGPKAQELLMPYLLRAENDFCFSPRDSEKNRQQQRHLCRVTPHTYGNSPGSNQKKSPKLSPGEKYTNDPYRRCINRACQAAGVGTWSPNRVRHLAATQIRKEFGIEFVTAVLGHSNIKTSEIYAEIDREKAEAVAKKLG